MVGGTIAAKAAADDNCCGWGGLKNWKHVQKKRWHDNRYQLNKEERKEGFWIQQLLHSQRFGN
jgi:hypothetical protein